MPTLHTKIADLPKNHRVWELLDVLADAAGADSTEEAQKRDYIRPDATIEDAMTSFLEVIKDGIYAELDEEMTAAEENRLFSYEK